MCDTRIVPNSDNIITSTKFPVTITTVAIFNGSFGTRELGPALLSAIRSVYSKPWNIILVDKLEYGRDDILYIIVCPAGLGIKQVDMPKYYINWQLEFMIGAYNVPAYIDRMRGAIDNWEYSTFNLAISHSRDNIGSIHVPPGFNETIVDPDILTGKYVYTDENKDIDVLFLGYCDAYPRRIEIRQNCFNAKLRVWFVSDLDLEGMRKVIKRSKVCLNMAAQDEFVLATVRLNILLSNQACIVSEVSVDKVADKLYSQNGICFVPYDNIVEKLWDLVHDFDTRRTMAIKSYQWYKNQRHWNDIVDFNKLLPST